MLRNAIALTLVIIMCFSELKAQQFTPQYNIPIGSHCNGFYEYLPFAYNPSGTQKYPLLIALHGVGERGDGSNNASTGLPLLIVPGKGIASLINSGGFPSSFTVNSNTYRFIVICPQFTDNGATWPGASDVSAIVNYAIANYKVDVNRVYLTGLSMGGGLLFNYVTNSASNANQIAAVVPVCAALQPGPPYASKPDSLACRTITGANLPLWATHNSGDLTVPVSFTDSLVHYINAAPSPTPLAKKTIFGSWVFDHDAWTQTYDPGYTGFEGTMNMYQWMLQYQRFITPLPVQLKNYRAYRSAPSAVTISWQSENESNNDHFTLERSANGKDFTSLAVIRGLNQNSNYSHVDDHPLKENYYRLSQTDKDGKINFYSVLRVILSNAKVDLNLTPNPASNSVKLSLYSESKETVLISISGSNGGLNRQWSVNKPSGTIEEIIPVANLAKGTYFVQVKGNTFLETRTFVRN
jgi:predicted esterase